MHECPDCGTACCCDQDDLWTEDNLACRCNCQWARDQGWDDDGHEPGCVLGSACLNAEPDHFGFECFGADDAPPEPTRPGWRQRLTRRLVDALAAEARRRRSARLGALAMASLVGRR